ncbi:RluA family pseudouridine synthase [Falsibacillus albus]|uniref:Pseudouridine synthase n=1 Tax=Falsibacillus albus TaxID=2478915 RepID=A0A3L7K954_9BACI|nr:RluA family pseudouridine synthase [Falsibacillus albus]RLQ97172.1 RluA family pseudouridine synthase [Falsibacillus albus]
MSKVYKISWEIKHEDAAKKIKQFLSEQNISKRALTDIKFAGGKITVNGEEVNVRYVLKEKDVLNVEFPVEIHSDGLVAETLPLNIVYEDDDVMVIDKQPYMNTIPSREHPKGSLANALLSYYKENGISSTIHIVTRLDRDTSGLLLVAKHRFVHHLLSNQQQKRLIQRTYQAVVEGIPTPLEETIDAPIGRKKTSIIEREVTWDGRPAVTHYKVLHANERMSLVQLNLETGRTHQIRVHMTYKGHPLIGDDLYGGNTELLQRQALHCTELSFFHPFQEKTLTFRSRLPKDLESLIGSNFEDV